MWRRRDAAPPADSETERPQDGVPFHAEAARHSAGAAEVWGVCGCPATARGGRAGQRSFFPSGIPGVRETPGGTNAGRWLRRVPTPCRVQNSRPQLIPGVACPAPQLLGCLCAAKLLLRHHADWNAAAVIDGYFDAETDPSTGNLFGGSAQLRRENSPIWLIRQPQSLDASLLIVVSKADRHSYDGVHYADSKQMIAQTRGYPTSQPFCCPPADITTPFTGRPFPPRSLGALELPGL
jgi:hypothetical protein